MLQIIINFVSERKREKRTLSEVASTMRIITNLVLATTLVSTTYGFTTVPQPQRLVAASGSTTTSSLSMGLLDFFSPEAQKAREEKKRREVEEQERLQKAIMERRKNPEKMMEYERKVAIRRELRMRGEDEKAEQVVIYEGVEEQTLLDGTKGL